MAGSWPAKWGLTSLFVFVNHLSGSCHVSSSGPLPQCALFFQSTHLQQEKACSRGGIWEKGGRDSLSACQKLSQCSESQIVVTLLNSTPCIIATLGTSPGTEHGLGSLTPWLGMGGEDAGFFLGRSHTKRLASGPCFAGDEVHSLPTPGWKPTLQNL
jgi:hypothetical protein